MTDAATLAPGTMAGRYRIEQPLTLTGPDGPAYRGHDAASQRRVVILEFLPPGIARRVPAGGGRVAPLDADLRPLYAAGLQEVQALALDFSAFRHPNALAILDCFAANDTVYLVTEMPEGRSLERLLGPGETLLPEEVQEILPSLLSGADAIHKAGLLHLDLCPAAIWIRRDGSAALGRAHLVRRTLGAPGRADNASPRDAYRAEEYFLPAGTLGPWSDIYALAATLFRLAIGTPPPDPLVRRAALAAGQPDPVGLALDAVMGQWPLPVVTAIRHGLAPAPANRPQSVAALRATLGAEGQREIPTLPLREPGAAPAAVPAGGPAPVAAASRTKPVVPAPYPEDAPTIRMERKPPAAAPAPPTPRRALTDAPPPSEAPTMRMPRAPEAPRVTAAPRGDASAEAWRGGSDPDATKPLYPPRPPKQMSGPPAGSLPPDDMPTVRMPQRPQPAFVPPPIVSPPALRDVDSEDKKTTVIYRRGRAEVITAPPVSHRPDGAAAPASDSEPAIHPARFSVFNPMLMTPGQWLDLAVYIHEPGIDSFVRQDHLARYEGRPGEVPERRGALRYSLKPGAAVTVVPYLPGCRVNPPRATAEFWENFHRLPFRVMASPGAPGYSEGPQTGTVLFFVGPLLVGEARVAFTIGREKAHPISNTATLAADTFDAVFPAYAPQDGEIADRFAAVAAQVDNPFLSEILALRARDWDREILKRIEAAERLQLFWSPAAARSPHLEEEWKFALALGRDHFIRAFYWRHPAPGLPAALDEADVALRPLVLNLE